MGEGQSEETLLHSVIVYLSVHRHRKWGGPGEPWPPHYLDVGGPGGAKRVRSPIV